ncbi:non-ribosomal peptide synthetase [Tengunoibacter tsumagoiensis]|uniref:Carrier domain-containing protein n=1 Tax=Tengunoibacter tsumagoiensis TaxID=2014871 RepID=A0A402A642_9CHLR|nr:non-ribosomal peptide synthetase [Tengunoibacter tsumagoiensis]GCE14614.1 hypothetical protein KTT_44730 [Tengunoibacter tsumagoiensis]
MTADKQSKLAGLSAQAQDLLFQRLQQKKKQSRLPETIPEQPRTGSSFPLSFAQERLWFLAQMEPETVHYTICRAVLIQGDLLISALEQAINRLVERHEILRTTFRQDDSLPVQIIAPFRSISLPLIRLEAGTEEAAFAWAQQEARRPFQLEQDPLLRFHLLCLNDQKHLLVLTIHHSIIDGWSLGLLFQELAAWYQRFQQADLSPLPAVGIQYADYALWQRQWLAEGREQRQLAYWKRQLAGAPAVLAFPTRSDDSFINEERRSIVKRSASKSLADRLQTLSQQEQVTPFTSYLAAFFLLLARYTLQDDLLVGTPIANRQRRELEQVIGYLANTLVLRARISGDLTWHEFVQQVSATTLDAYAHQDLPFERLVESLQPERSLKQTPLIQVLFSFHSDPEATFNLPGLSTQTYQIDPGSATFLLTVAVEVREQELHLSAQYQQEQLSPAMVSQFLRHYELVLEQIVAHPEAQIKAFSLCTEEERSQLISKQISTAFPAQSSIQELFAEYVQRTPDAIALRSGSQTLTYWQLAQQSDWLAQSIAEQGVGPDVPVVLFVERSLAFIIALLAILKAGGAYVVLESSWPLERKAFVIDQLRPPVLVTSSHLLSQLPPIEGRVLYLDQLPLLEGGPWRGPDCDARQLAYISYTSGSTGWPKGVMVSHQNVVRLIRNTNYAQLHHERFLQLSAVAFDASTFEIWGALLNGSELVIAPAQQLSLHEIRALVEREYITTLWLTAGLFQQMVEHEPETFRSLHQALAGGDIVALPPALKALQYLPAESVLINGYGPTENTTFTTCYRLPGQSQGLTGSFPIGSPIANTSVFILDPYLQPVPTGLIGELYTGGAGLARGYCNRPDLTAERFIPHPFSSQPGDRLYATGDLARYRVDGVIEFIGRRDNQVKIRGFRVELGEIESVLWQTQLVRSCAVVYVCPVGSQEKSLVAYIVLRDQVLRNQTLQARAQLQQQVQQVLPDYMRPAIWLFKEQLPLTANGKVDRRALPLPTVQAKELESVQDHGQPVDPIQEYLVQLWASLLKQGPIGIHDNFFAAGGHSLLATQLIARIRATFHQDLPLRAIFEAPTIAQLSERIIHQQQSSQAHERLTAISRQERQERLPLNRAQRRLWFLQQVEPENIAYHVPFALRFVGQLDHQALDQSLQEIVRRHEALRTIFLQQDNEPFQRLLPSLVLSLPIDDFSQLPPAEREQIVQEALVAEARVPFDLQLGPLIRAHLFQLAAEEHILLIVMHHIITDGWSLNVFFTELAQLYTAYVQHQPSPLLELPVQTIDYAYWQQSRVVDSQLAYWKEQLAGAPTVFELPYRTVRPPVQSYRGARQLFTLPASLLQQLQIVAINADCTLFMVVLAAFDVVMAMYSGQSDFLLGMPIANRTRPEIEGLIGFFVNTLLLRAQLTEVQTLPHLLSKVRDVVLGASAHQDLPFEQLVEVLQPHRDASRNPLFQIEFVFNNVVSLPRDLPNLTVELLRVSNGTEQFDLTCAIADTGSGLQVLFEYNSDLFEAAFIQRLAEQYRAVLERMTLDPAQSLSSLMVITEEQLEHLRIWGGWQSSLIPSELSFFNNWHPWSELPAVIVSGQVVTYQQLFSAELPAAIEEQSENHELLMQIRALLQALTEDGHYSFSSPGTQSFTLSVTDLLRQLTLLTAAYQNHALLHQEGERILLLAPLYTIDLLEFALPALSRGATLVLVSASERLRIRDHLSDFLSEQAISTIIISAREWPHWYAHLRQYPRPTALRTILLYGRAETQIALHTTKLPELSLVAAFRPQKPGLTTLLATVHENGLHPHLLANVNLAILDQQGGPVPIGVIGELAVNGNWLERQAASDSKDSPIFPASAEGLYRTGEWGKFTQEGQLQLFGTTSTRVRLQESMIDLIVIEQMLSEQVGVLQAAVSVDAEGSLMALIAYILPYAGQQPDPLQIKKALQQQLPGYMVPEHILIVPELIFLPDGQLDRRMLPQPSRTRQQVFAATANEQLLLQIWRKVLQKEQISMQDNFFEQGGHSLLLLQVHSQLPPEIKEVVSVVNLFQYPTILALSTFISAQRQTKGVKDQGKKAAQSRLQALQRKQPLRKRP